MNNINQMRSMNQATNQMDNMNQNMNYLSNQQMGGINPQMQSGFNHPNRMNYQQPQVSNMGNMQNFNINPINQSMQNMSIQSNNQNPQMNLYNNSQQINQQQFNLNQTQINPHQQNNLLTQSINPTQFQQNKQFLQMQNQAKIPNPGQMLPQQQPQPMKKERLYLKMTNEERGTFSNLFQIADRESKGILQSKDAAEFLKKSGLPKETLKQIWLIANQICATTWEKDEFYIALRLIALAQNNMPITADAIRTNQPIPPLPVFNLKKNVSEQEIETIFAIDEKDIQKYTRFFNTNKEMGERINLGKACQMWKSANISDETLNKIVSIVPLKENGFVNWKEFIVSTHLVYRSINNDIPLKLPGCLSTYLLGAVPNKNQEQTLAQKQPLNLDTLLPQLGGNPTIQMQSQLQPQPVVQNQQNNIINNHPDNYRGQVNQVNNNQGYGTEPQIPLQKDSLSNVNQNLDQFKKTDEDILWVSTWMEEIEKTVKLLNENNTKNEQTRLQIHEVKDKWKQGKDNLVKLALSMNTNNQAIFTSIEEWNKIKNSYEEVMKEKNKLQDDYYKEREKVEAIKRERAAKAMSNQEEWRKAENERGNNQGNLSNIPINNTDHLSKGHDNYSESKSPAVDSRMRQQEMFSNSMEAGLGGMNNNYNQGLPQNIVKDQRYVNTPEPSHQQLEQHGNVFPSMEIKDPVQPPQQNTNQVHDHTYQNQFQPMQNPFEEPQYPPVYSGPSQIPMIQDQHESQPNFQIESNMDNMFNQNFDSGFNTENNKNNNNINMNMNAKINENQYNFTYEEKALQSNPYGNDDINDKQEPDNFEFQSHSIDNQQNPSTPNKGGSVPYPSLATVMKAEDNHQFSNPQNPFEFNNDPMNNWNMDGHNNVKSDFDFFAGGNNNNHVNAIGGEFGDFGQKPWDANNINMNKNIKDDDWDF